jgi:hypothetical protein
VTASAKAETPATPLASTPVATEAKTETPEPAPATDRVIAMAPAPSAQPSAPPQPQPVTAKDDGAPQIGSASKIREGELRREREKDSRMQRTERRAEARPQLRKRREIEAAANAVRQMQRDNAVQEVSQRVQDDAVQDDSVQNARWPRIAEAIIRTANEGHRGPAPSVCCMKSPLLQNHGNGGSFAGM